MASTEVVPQLDELKALWPVPATERIRIVRR